MLEHVRWAGVYSNLHPVRHCILESLSLTSSCLPNHQHNWMNGWFLKVKAVKYFFKKKKKKSYRGKIAKGKGEIKEGRKWTNGDRFTIRFSPW